MSVIKASSIAAPRAMAGVAPLLHTTATPQFQLLAQGKDRNASVEKERRVRATHPSAFLTFAGI
jgi:hypothetical protein